MKHAHLSRWTAAIAACWLLVWVTEAHGPVALAAEADSPSASQPGGPGAAESPATEGEDKKTSATVPEAGLEKATSPLARLKLLQIWGENGPWEWSILLGTIFLGMVAGWIVATVLTRLGKRFEASQWTVRAHLATDLIGPAKLAMISLGLAVGLAQIKGMSDPLLLLWQKVLLLLYAVAAFWYAFNLVSVIDVLLCRLTAKTESNLDDQVVPLVRKSLRVFLVVLGVMFVVDSVFSQDITAWLAGLGIAGLAVSLAARPSLENLFGSITILFDRPFKLGERIVYGGFDGTVEEIGFRSTKIRTLTGHVVTIPNSKIVSDPVENIGRRQSIRRIMNVTITYDTPREKIEQAVGILRGILEEEDLRGPIHAVIDGKEFPPRAYFNDYNAESLNIILIYWYAPPAYWDYLDHAQQLNLRIFEEFDKAGIEFAFPTQTLYLAGDPKREMAVRMLGKDL